MVDKRSAHNVTKIGPVGAKSFHTGGRERQTQQSWQYVFVIILRKHLKWRT